jgi:hypothetical protein
MDKPLSAWDRMVYGAIAAAFGVLLSLGACVCLLFAFSGTPPVRWIVLSSAVYFFIVGAVRGARAADLTREAATVVGGVAMAETGAIPGATGNSDSMWSAWSSPVLLCTWLALVGILTWWA